MKSSPILPAALIIAAASLAGCRNVTEALDPTPKHAYANCNRREMRVTVRSKTDGASLAGKTFRLVPASACVEADIDFNRYKKMVESGLISLGFVPASGDSQASLLVRLDYGAGEPVTLLSERQDPTYAITPARTVVKTEYDEKTRTSKRITLEEPEVRTGTGYQTVVTSTTQYPYYVSLHAVGGGPAPVFIVECTIRKNEQSADGVLPALITAAALNAGLHRDQPVDQAIRESTVARLREFGKLPPPRVNPHAEATGLFGAFATCRVDVRSAEPARKQAVYDEACRRLRWYGITVVADAPVAITLQDGGPPHDSMALSIGKAGAATPFYMVSQRDFGITAPDTPALVRWLFEEAALNSDFEKFMP